MRRNLLIFVLLAAMLVVSACNYVMTQPPTQIPPDAAYTQAAETIIAQLTAITGGSEGAAATPGATQPVGSGAATAVQENTATMSPTNTSEPTSTSEPTDTPELTATAEPSATLEPSATPTLSSADPKASLGTPDLQDKFRNGNNWSLYEDDHVRFRIKDDQLLMMAFNADGRDSWMLSWPDAQDLYIEMTAQPQSCSGSDRYGLIIRSDADTGYLFGLTCDGSYSLRKWNGEKFTNLVAWTESAQILSGADQTNRLGIWAKGNQFRLYINGVLVGEAKDGTYEHGGFGVFVGAKNTTNFKVNVSQLSYWELP